MTVLPVYLIHWNAPEWCASAARSILASRGVDVRLTVIDNGQRGGPPLRDLLPKGVRVISTSTNLGYAGGANVALWDWAMTFPDSDLAVIGAHDLHVEPDALALLTSAARQYPDYGVLGPVLIAPFVSFGGVRDGIHFWQLSNCLPGDPEFVAPRDWVSGTCMVLRRSCVQDVGGFDSSLGSYYEDVDFCLRASGAGWKVGIVKQARAWGLGSIDPEAPSKTLANGVRVARRIGGRRAMARAVFRLVIWAVRAGLGSLAIWRSADRRSASVCFFRRYMKALRLSCRRADPLVTVVIPTRNRLGFLKEAVDSVFRQTYRNWELIVVDDASEDGTWEWLQSLSHPGVRVFRQPERRERSAARNRGLAEARGEYVLFLDDDDRLTPCALECLVAALDRYPKAVFAAGARVVFNEGGGRIRISHPRVRSLRREPWRDVLVGWVSGQGQTLFRTARLREAGGWDETLAGAEDQELLLRVGLLGPAVFVPAVVLENRAHPGQWRPQDVSSVEEEFRREFVSNLRGRKREVAERLLGVRYLLREATEAYHGGSFRRASRLILRAVLSCPGILMSPLTRPGVLGLWVRSMAGALAGPGALGCGRKVVRWFRRATGRELRTYLTLVDVSARIGRRVRVMRQSQSDEDYNGDAGEEPR